MMARYSKADREAAAVICAVAASTPERMSTLYCHVAAFLYASEQAEELAFMAFMEARRRLRRIDSWRIENDAEAEALIRTGWSPK